MPGWKRRPSYDKNNIIEFDEGREDYTPRELEQLADQLLRAQARSIDPRTGKERGIGGEDPILFEEHIHQRRRREILNEAGVPDPSLGQGMYFRTHPEGRKVNSEEARKRHGASYYRHHEPFPDLFSFGAPNITDGEFGNGTGREETLCSLWLH